MHRPPHSRHLYAWIRIALISGAVICMVFFVLGFIFLGITGKELTNAVIALPQILPQAFELDPLAIITLGILALLLTPIAVVILAIAAFIKEGDRLYTIISMVVLAVLLISISMAIFS